jgi:hypothetical protein
MNDCKKCQPFFLEAFYEELDAEQADFFKQHIELCASCKSRFDEMSSTLDFMSKRVRPEPEKSYWDSYEERLIKRIDEEGRIQPEKESRRKRFTPAFNLAPRWVYQAAAAFVLIAAGIFIGRTIFSPSAAEIQQASQQVISQQPGIQLASRTHSYIERSKLILLALVNFDPITEDPYALNLPYQQQASQELVQEASLLRRDLADSDQRRLERLIADLEVILLQIANLEAENDFEAIELLKDGVNTKGVLMEINLADFRRFINKNKPATSQKKPLSKPKAF